MLSIDSILNKLKSLDKIKLNTNKLGVASSYARGTARQKSDIDIVSDSYDMSLENREFIKDYIRLKFNKKCDILCLGLLKEEDEELDSYLVSLGLEVNDVSVYKSVVKEVV